MCGQASVSQRILDHYESQGKLASIFFSDGYQNQFAKAKENLNPYKEKGHMVTGLLEDIRSFPLLGPSLDVIVIKMGLHELRKEDQKEVVKRLMKNLTPSGDLFIWESMGQTPEINNFFKKVVRKKDELAGYRSFVRDRYFCTEEEIIDLAEKSGAREIEKIYEGNNFDYVTRVLSEADFGGDTEKLRELNEYIRSISTPKIAQSIRMNDSGDSIKMHFAKKIFRIRK